MTEDMDRDRLKIGDIINILKRRWKVIASITLITTIFSIVFSFYIVSPKYEATTKVFIGKQNSSNSNYSDNDVSMYQKLLKTYAELITTNNLVEKAINKDGIDVTSEDVIKGLTVTPRTDTQILEITYVSKDKYLAKDVLDSITNEFIESSTELIPNGTVKMIENVKVPTDPVSPNKKINICIGFLIGLMASVALTFLIEFINNTVSTKEQLEQLLGIPVIGTIPDDCN